MVAASMDLNSSASVDRSRVLFKIASSMAERRAAFRLVYRSYLRARLIDSNPHRMRVTPFHLLPTTAVFVAKLRNRVISTVSLVADAEMGLPMETTYPDVVAELREQGLRLGEVTCLADRRHDFRGFLRHFCQLTRLLAQYARRQGLDRLVVMTHPKHARFYRRTMGFAKIGGLAQCPQVRDNPAVALSLDFAGIDRERPVLYEAIFGHTLPAQQLEPQPIPPVERDYLEPLIDPCFAASPAQPVCAI